MEYGVHCTPSTICSTPSTVLVLLYAYLFYSTPSTLLYIVATGGRNVTTGRTLLVIRLRLRSFRPSYIDKDFVDG